MNKPNPAMQIWEAYKKRPKKRQKESFWQFLRKENPYVLSNHPPVPVFREHVWSFFGFYFSKGLIASFGGMFIGFIVYLSTNWLKLINDWQTAIVFCLLLLPTIVTVYLKSSRPLKLLARIIQGFLSLSAFVKIFNSDHWLTPLIIIAVYFLVRIPLSRKRKREDWAIFQREQAKFIRKKTGPYIPQNFSRKGFRSPNKKRR